jgi:hypothetical protein
MTKVTWWLGGNYIPLDTASEWANGAPANGSGDYAFFGSGEATTGAASTPSTISGYTIILTGQSGLYDVNQTTFGPGMNVATTYGGWDAASQTGIMIVGGLTNRGVTGVSSVGWLAGNSMQLYAHAGSLNNVGTIYSSGPGSSLVIQTEDQYPWFSGTFANNGVLITNNSATMTINGAIQGRGSAYVMDHSRLVIEGPDNDPGVIGISNSTLEFSPHPNFMTPDYPAENFMGRLELSGASFIQIDGEIGASLTVSTTELLGASVLAMFDAGGDKIAGFTIAGVHGAGAFSMTNSNGDTFLAMKA